jgi:hypothetical protein
MDPEVSQMTIGCGISHNNTITYYTSTIHIIIKISHNTNKGFT